MFIIQDQMSLKFEVDILCFVFFLTQVRYLALTGLIFFYGPWEENRFKTTSKYWWFYWWFFKPPVNTSGFMFGNVCSTSEFIMIQFQRLQQDIFSGVSPPERRS